VYRTDGPHEASRQTGIPQRTISTWARRAGLKSDATQKTTSATQAAAARRRKLREEGRVLLLEKRNGLLRRLDEPHYEFKTVPGSRDVVGRIERVDYDRAPSGAVKDYAVAVGILTDKIQLIEGEATDRVEWAGIDPREVIAQGRERARELSERAR
jgi:hypothetical protein